ncbi:unnamed protein product [Clonostachys chloroleuca]|uniref:Calpain catalytic domain-containing protein n=1 Tax=Clonostachys chloroleuca TaxID=1926264 RepID=A0AA35M6P7_9HYPO|nr:unnamed protein product [Clonostachys chloroleuca]
MAPREHHPQALMARFWKKFHHRTPGKVTSIFPSSMYDAFHDDSVPASARVRNAAGSYDEARAECAAMVQEIVEHCEATNTSFLDKEFELEHDYYMQIDDCLRGLIRKEEQSSRPGGVHRVPWIYENPRFNVDGFSGSDIAQGALGDCWWLAGLGTIAHRKDLMDKVCVARNEECGVYGFVFFRDGEWVPTIIDDNLYLSSGDWTKAGNGTDATGSKARAWKKNHQTGSGALYMASCKDENETWLPLLEKAYAKAHGDYEALEGGWIGAGVEDMTGGVSSVVLTSRVLRKDKLWHELRQVDQDDGQFVYGLAASFGVGTGERNGLMLNHAYSVIKAVEIEDATGRKVKLLQIRNPWGQNASTGLGEWHGPWSDGSKEWTPETMKKLNHEFGDDGVFWMTLDDVLHNFQWLNRTRLFNDHWTVAQQWTSLPISWIPGYLNTKFVIQVEKPGLAVIVLSKPDERYYDGLEGQYRFFLEFMVRSDESDKKIAEATYNAYEGENRSVSCEVYLEPGTYSVIPKVLAKRCAWKYELRDVVKSYALTRPLKLQQKAKFYDTAHAKPGVKDEDEELQIKKWEERQRKKELKRKTEEDNSMQLELIKLRSYISALHEEMERREKSKVEEQSKDKANENQKQRKKSRGKSKPAAEDNAKGQRGGQQAEAEEAAEEEEEAPEEEENQEEEEEQAEEEEEEDDDDDDDSEFDDDDDDDYDDSKDRYLWNPVCVMGLRVYSEDDQIEIKLVEGDEQEEGEEEAEGEEGEEEGEEGEEEEEE